jgi:rhodanese-related sulfurtransferase
LNKRSLICLSALILVFLATFLIFTEQGKEKGKENSSGFENISVQEAKEMVEKGNVFILDVRTPDEFSSSHIKGATLIPVSNASGSNLSSDRLLEARLDEIPKKKILVYCKSGRRSVSASTMLVDAGYSEVYNMAGGINAWIDAGYPVVSSEDIETDDGSRD